MSDDDQPQASVHEDPTVQEEEPARTWQEWKADGNALFKAQAYEEAIAAYSKAIAGQPAEASLWSNRSACFLLLKKFGAAMDDASKCLDIDAEYVKAYGRYATAACNLGRFRDAIVMLERGLQRCAGLPNAAVITNELNDAMRLAKTADGALQKARGHLDRNEETFALRAVSDVATHYPDCFELAAVISAARAPSGSPAAMSVLNGFSKTHGDVPEYHYARAYASYFAGAQGMKNALVLLKQVLELDPDHAAAKTLFKRCREAEKMKNLGNEAYKARQWDAAVTHYSNAASIDPKNKAFNAVILGNRAAARLELRQYTGALSDVTFAIEGGQDAPKFYARRSRIHEQLENWDDATRDMKRAAESDDAYERDVRDLAKRIKLASRKDWYKVLGVSRNATEKEIKKGYRTAAMEWHPDKWTSATDAEKVHAEKKFKEVGEAHAILSDAQKRQLYDSGAIDNETDHASGGASRGGGGGGGMGGMTEEDLMAAFMSGGMGGMGGGMGGGPFGGMGGGRPQSGRRRGGGMPGGMPGGFSFGM